MIKSNPFTPQSGWEPRVFAGRRGEIDRFARTVKQAAESRPNHLIVLGEWGTGKTSLLKQFKKIAQERGHLASFCPISKFSTKDSTRDGIGLICQEILLGFPRLGGRENLFEGVETADTSLPGLGDQFKKRKAALQPQVELTKFLLEIWKHLATKLAVVLLDDVQNLSTIPEVIDILRSVLSKDQIIDKTRFLFVLSSTPAGWSSFVDKHDPVGRFFRNRETIENLTRKESIQMMDDTLKDTGVTFSAHIKDNIYRYTQGHPYELQLLCSHLYEAQIGGVVKDAAWDSGFREALKELGKDYFDSLFRRASERERDLLETLAEEKRPMSISDLRTVMIVQKRARNFPVANIKNFLYRLEVKGLLRRTEEGDFKILDPMFTEFITGFKR